MDRATLSGLKELMRVHGLKPKKMYGQNFLVDKNILYKIIAASGVESTDIVLEIGPGMGALSEQLALTAQGVLAVEIDQGLQDILIELEQQYPNLHILWGDILKTDIEAELALRWGEQALNSYRVCANIPYQITSPILFKLLLECPRMVSASLMMQKEVANRLLASPGGKDYGRLTVMAHYYAEIELLMMVSRHCFYPQPKVDSAVVKIKPRGDDRTEVNTERLDRIVRAAFQQRRKTLVNALAPVWPGDKASLQAQLEALGLDPQARPEMISPAAFIRLAEML